MRTLADMTPQERARCRGMWCEIDTPVGPELAIYDQSRWTKEPTLFEPEYGYFETDLSKVTPRPDLPRAWQADGQPPAGEWEHAEYLGDYKGMTNVYHFDGEPTHRRWVGEWEEA